MIAIADVGVRGPSTTMMDIQESVVISLIVLGPLLSLGILGVQAAGRYMSRAIDMYMSPMPWRAVRYMFRAYAFLSVAFFAQDMSQAPLRYALQHPGTLPHDELTHSRQALLFLGDSISMGWAVGMLGSSVMLVEIPQLLQATATTKAWRPTGSNIFPTVLLAVWIHSMVTAEALAVSTVLLLLSFATVSRGVFRTYVDALAKRTEEQNPTAHAKVQNVIQNPR